MSMTLVIALNAVLDLGIVLALAAVMAIPFRLDRRRKASRAPAHSLPAPVFEVELAA